MKRTFATTLGLGLVGVTMLAAPHKASAVEIGHRESENRFIRPVSGQRVEITTTNGMGPGLTRSVGLGVRSPSTPPQGGLPGRESDLPTAPVPEPGTMALISMGLLSLGAASRRAFGRSPRSAATPE